MADRAPRSTMHGADGTARAAGEASLDALGFASILGARLAHGDDGLALATILTSARRVVALIESRDVLGADAPRVVVPVDVGVALRRVLDLNRMAFTARGVALTTEPAPGVMAKVDELDIPSFNTLRTNALA